MAHTITSHTRASVARLITSVSLLGLSVAACVRTDFSPPMQYQNVHQAENCWGDGPEASNSGDYKNPYTDIHKMACGLSLKYDELYAARDKFWNQSEVFDIPILGLALTTAGLLVLDSGDAMMGGVDGAAELGFAAAALTVIRDYRDPSAVSNAYSYSLTGHLCLASVSRTVRDYGPLLANLGDRSVLIEARANLKKLVDDASASDAVKKLHADAVKAIAEADKALVTINTQIAAYGDAAERLYGSAFTLTENARKVAARSPVNFNTVIDVVKKSVTSTLAFSKTVEENSGGATPQPMIDDLETIDDTATRRNTAAAAKNTLSLEVQTMLKALPFKFDGDRDQIVEQLFSGVGPADRNKSYTPLDSFIAKSADELFLTELNAYTGNAGPVSLRDRDEKDDSGAGLLNYQDVLKLFNDFLDLQRIQEAAKKQLEQAEINEFKTQVAKLRTITATYLAKLPDVTTELAKGDQCAVFASDKPEDQNSGSST